jgi:predicted NBD/HSP70 family sugar kinase/transposase
MLSAADRRALRQWAADRPDRFVRARIVLDAEAGVSVAESARALGVSRPTVTSWRKRFAAGGLAGLEHNPRSGRPPHIDEAEVIASTLVGPVPPDRIWSARGLAEQLGISRSVVSAVWRRWNVEGELRLPGFPGLRHPELVGLAVAGADAVVVLADGSVEPHGAPVGYDERQALTTSLTVEFSQLPQDSVVELPAFVRTLRDRARQLQVLSWGSGESNWQQAPATFSWAAVVCVVALLELRDRPAAARRAYESLLDRLRTAGPFCWQRDDATRPLAAAAPRAFDQLTLGSFNEKVVIESIRTAGELSRVEIAARTGLTPQAVSRIARNLLTSGFLVEAEHRPAGKGKPRIPLRLRPDACYALGIHLDPEVITQVVVDLCGGVVDRRQLSLADRRDPAWCIDQIASMADEALAVIAPKSFLGAGVAVPGPVDTAAGVIVNPPLFPEWRDVPLRDTLSDRLGMPVTVEKDATAAAVGERWIGAADRAGDFVYLYLGTGAGTGAFLNGDVYRGVTGNAGEIGELCALTIGLLTPEGGPQMVPECAPMSAVVERFSGSYADACAAAGAGDERAVAAFAEVASVIARGAIGVIDLLDVSTLIVGGPAVSAEVTEIYLAAVSAAVNRFPVAAQVRQVRVVRSVLNEAAAAVGAASAVFHSTFAPRLRG